jgi:hypothetical protein
MNGDDDIFTQSLLRAANTHNSVEGFLALLYHSPSSLTDVLRQCGFSDGEIEKLGTVHLSDFPSTLLAEWNRHLAVLLSSPRHLPGDPQTERRVRIITRRYGLDGHDRSTLTELGEEYGVCAERIRQIRNKAVRQLGQPEAVAQMEDILIELARSLLYPLRPQTRAVADPQE